MPSFVSPKSSKRGYLGGLLAENRQNMGVCYFFLKIANLRLLMLRFVNARN